MVTYHHIRQINPSNFVIELDEFPLGLDLVGADVAPISHRVFGDVEKCGYLHMDEQRIVMKRFFKIFIPLVAIVLVLQLLGFLVLKWTEGMECQDFLSGITPLLVFAIPSLYLYRSLDNKLSPYGFLPLLACYFSGVYAIFYAPDTRGWLLWMLVNILAVFIATCWALFKNKQIEERNRQETESYKKSATSFLKKFKTAIRKQYFVVSEVETKTCLIIIDDDDFLYLLPDGRKLAILKRHRKLPAFEDILDDFRSDANNDLDVLGYIDNDETSSHRMVISDGAGHHQSIEKGNASYIPFDFSLLEKVQPVFPLDYFGETCSSHRDGKKGQTI